MKLALSLLIAGLTFGQVWSALSRDTNSSRASAEGAEAWSREESSDAVSAYGRAWSIRGDSTSSFNLGTALAAAGERERAVELLRKASEDEKLAGSAFYNEGTLELIGGNLDEAIEALRQSLRLDPGNIGAKRNLEIALQNREREESQDRQESGEGEGDQDEQEQPGEAEDPGEDAESGDEGEADPRLESILQSVQDQEREELSRMRRARARSRGNDW